MSCRLAIRLWLVSECVAAVVMLIVWAQRVDAGDLPAQDAKTLPGTQELLLEEPLDVVMVRGINHFAERELNKSHEQRNAPWQSQPIDTPEGKSARDAARKEWKEIIGFPEPLSSVPQLSIAGSEVLSAEHTAPWADYITTVVSTCQWNTTDRITGRGMIAVPKQLRLEPQKTVPFIVVIPDANQTPEQCFGIQPGIPDDQQYAKILALQGYVVLCPALIDLNSDFSGHPAVRFTNQTHREFTYRLGFELGRHPIGYDVAKVLTGIQAVQREFPESELKVAAIGTGEGGLIALAAAAADAEAIQAVATRGYFSERNRVWEEPIYRNIYGQLKKFGDAELASLIAPRRLIIDASNAAEIDPPKEIPNRATVAAPGVIRTPQLDAVKREFARAQAYYHKAGAPDGVLLTSGDSAESQTIDSLNDSLNKLGASPVVTEVAITLAPTIVPPSAEYLKARSKAQVDEINNDCYRILHSCHHTRRELWSKAKLTTPEEFSKSMEEYRNLVHDTFIGRLPNANVPHNARSRKVIDTPTHSGFEITIDVIPAPAGDPKAADALNQADPGIFAGGILLLPKDLKPNEKRPVVVFQHGLEGTPNDTITEDKTTRQYQAYQAASTELVKRGFIVYAPQNPFRGFDHFRVIQRKSNPLGRSLFSYIIEQHRQTLRWLGDQSYVDPARIAFYGISYGGKTAVRVPPMLPPTADQPGYCLSICSADFNEWILKNASGEDRYSYVFHGEYEIFEWNMGNIANYAELTWLMIPRPFMVERGLDDGVAPDEWVAYEFAKVQRAYMKLGIRDLAEIEYFDGPHAIHGVGTYKFLHKHLNWPER